LLLQGRVDGEQALDEAAAERAVGPKADVAPLHCGAHASFARIVGGFDARGPDEDPERVLISKEVPAGARGGRMTAQGAPFQDGADGLAQGVLVLEEGRGANRAGLVPVPVVQDLLAEAYEGRTDGGGLGRALLDLLEVPQEMGPASARKSLGKEEEIRNLSERSRGFDSPTAKASNQPEASLAWRMATYVVKRRQRVPKPCD
jgi:hypothetical protein